MPIFSDVSIQTRFSASLMLFFIAVTSNFLTSLYPKDHLHFLNKNFYIKYFLGYIVMIFSIFHLADLQNPFSISFIALVLYLWFIFTTFIPPIYTVFIVILLSISFMLDIKIKGLQDNAYSKTEKQRIYNLKQFQFVIFIFVVFIPILGYFIHKLINPHKK